MLLHTMFRQIVNFKFCEKGVVRSDSPSDRSETANSAQYWLEIAIYLEFGKFEHVIKYLLYFMPPFILSTLNINLGNTLVLSLFRTIAILYSNEIHHIKM